jgi:L-ribulokinase
MAAGVFPTIEAAQRAVCLPHKTFTPRRKAVAVYDELFQLFRKAYFALGTRGANVAPMGDILPELRELAQKSRGAQD